MVQADFLTHTSREGIREQDPWNLHLRDAIAVAFIEAITSMKTHPALSKTFIRFIPNRIEDSFLGPICQPLMKQLSNMPLIWTMNGLYANPKCVLIVSPRLFYQEKPLFAENGLEYGGLGGHEYVHPDLASDTAILDALGCRKLDDNHAGRIMSNHSFPFPEKSIDWIRRLFEYLSQTSVSSRPFYYKKARYLRLTDGKWTSLTESRKVYLPGLGRENYGDLGIRCSILDEGFYRSISENNSAKFFLTSRLGLQSLGLPDVIEEIAQLHLDGSVNSDLCFGHIRFLMDDQSWLRSKNERLIDHFNVVDTTGRVKQAKEVLVDWKFEGNAQISPTSLSEICNSDALSFLSSEYTTKQRDLLKKYMGLKASPPLISTNMWGTANISRIYAHSLSPRQLGNNLLLYYIAHININLNSYGTGFFSFLRQMEFQCTNGAFIALSECYLETGQLKHFVTEDMNILQIESPDSSQWDFLSKCGVRTKPDLELHLNRLRFQKKNVRFLHEPGSEDLLYQELVTYCLPSPRSDDLNRYG